MLSTTLLGSVLLLAPPVIDGIGPAGEVRVATEGLVFTEGPAGGPDGSLYFSDPPQQKIYELKEDGTRRLLAENTHMCNGLAVDRKGMIIACQGASGKLVSIDPATGALTPFAESYKGVRFNQPNDLVLDSVGGVYFTDPMYGLPNGPQKTMGLYYVASNKEVARLAEGLPLPNGIGLSPDEKTLYVVTIRTKELLAYSVKSPGVLIDRRVFCTTATGSDGITVDSAGNVYVTQPSLSAIDVFSPAGKKLGSLSFESRPANCGFGGKDGKTLFVTARKTVYAVPMYVRGIGFK
ncbi:SMP-30/gluconolactonase/LRE family protein [bacterium]|nr:SMP-30/gluconolactonase/LRE family protein [bacterium]